MSARVPHRTRAATTGGRGAGRFERGKGGAMASKCRGAGEERVGKAGRKEKGLGLRRSPS